MSRKSKTRKHRKEPSKLGAYVISSLMIVLMIASFAGVMLYAPSDPNKITYNDITFSIDEKVGAYTAELNGKQLFFQYLPAQTLPVTIDFEAINFLKTAQAYAITFDPVQDPQILQLFDYSRLSLQTTLVNVIPGVTQASDDYKLPIFDCANSTVEVPVILLRNGTPNSIMLENNCVIIQGVDAGLLMAKDAFIYAYNDVYLPEDQKLMEFNNE